MTFTYQLFIFRSTDLRQVHTIYAETIILSWDWKKYAGILMRPFQEKYNKALENIKTKVLFLFVLSSIF